MWEKLLFHISCSMEKQKKKQLCRRGDNRCSDVAKARGYARSLSVSYVVVNFFNRTEFLTLIWRRISISAESFGNNFPSCSSTPNEFPFFNALIHHLSSIQLSPMLTHCFVSLLGPHFIDTALLWRILCTYFLKNNSEEIRKISAMYGIFHYSFLRGLKMYQITTDSNVKDTGFQSVLLRHL